MISAALWSTIASCEGSARSGSTDRSPDPQASSIVDVVSAAPIVLLEVVARGADDLGGPRQVLADVVIVDRRQQPEALDEQPAERGPRRRQPSVAGTPA